MKPKSLDEQLADFLLGRKINTFQKLQILLFLARHPQYIGTLQNFAKRLHLADTHLLERVIRELLKSNLIVQIDERYTLTDDPELGQQLNGLVQAFECPLQRQEILGYVQRIDNFRIGKTFRL